mgnify:CR=1 FL=1
MDHVIVDIGCREATDLKNNSNPSDPLVLVLLEKHEQSNEHTPDCYVSQVPKSSPH